jgi:hypothetical protein
MRLAKHESERDNEELVALIVADMQDPVTPILEAALVGEGLHDTGRVVTRFSKIINHGAETIDENLLRVGAVKIDLGHVQSPSNGTGSRKIHRCWRRCGIKAGSIDARKSCNHIQAVMRGNRIICAPLGLPIVSW